VDGPLTVCQYTSKTRYQHVDDDGLCEAGQCTAQRSSVQIGKRT